MIQFSLFEGDLLNRLFSRLRLGGRKPGDLFGRVVCFWILTYIPMALLAWCEGLGASRPPAENFFYDIAAYAIFFVGTPLFIVAEGIISSSTRGAAVRFATHGALKEEDAATLDQLHLTLERLRRKTLPEILCIFYACVFSYYAINTERFDDTQTWHALGPSGAQSFTAAGIWCMCIALPIANYLWVRWVWKIGMWCWYLYRISRFHLKLLASHPDKTGGIGFLSEVQSKFGILILAYGISNVAAVTIYKLTIEGAELSLLPVWMGISSFVIGAPTLFLLPLFFFTKQLYRCKKRAIERYEERAMERAAQFESKWLNAIETGSLSDFGGSELSGLNNLNNVYDRIQHMRVVPFDLRSVGELFASALGPMLPLLPYLNVLPDPVVKAIEQTLKLLKG
ncbi:MAG: hypothetical protein J0M12_11685 [Deltaproteobacteria bacterium]|nr:hypothetical protein [Deltaproteobacteria bacterium]